MNKKYFVYKIQKQEGCDYTIGCGISLEELEATSMNEAIEQVIDLPDSWREDFKKMDKDEWHDYIHDTILDRIRCSSSKDEKEFNREFELEEINILEVSKVVDLIPLIKSKKEEVHLFLSKEKKSDEFKEYKRLKKKFEK